MKKLNKKKIAAILTALGAALALAQQCTDALPDAPAPSAIDAGASDAGVR